MPGDDDPDQVERLLAVFPEASYEDLLRIRTPTFSTDDPRLIARFEAYRSSIEARGREFLSMAREQVRVRYGGPPADGLVVDIGCGVGACTLSLATSFEHVVGIEPSLPDLILARKALEERNLGNVTLVQGTMQTIPLPDASVTFAIAENVLEHVVDLTRGFAEVGRVLTPGGVFVGDCVNRYNLLRPEPHVKLWGVGYLPRRLQAPYVRWRRNFIGYDRSVHLPSYRELKGALERGIGTDSRVGFPAASAFGFSRKLDGALAALERIPVLSTAVLCVFPLFLAVGRRT